MSLTHEEIAKLKRKAKKQLNTHVGQDILEILNKLKEFNEQGEYDWYAEFNGHTFYSVDINVEEAFKQVTGYTPEEFDIYMKEKYIKTEENKKRSYELAKKKKEERIKEGSKRISIYKKDAWEELINELSKEGKDWNHAMDMIIKYLAYLNDEEYKDLTIKEIADMYIKEFDGEVGDWYTTGIVTHIAEFSDRGPEFDEEVANQMKIIRPGRIKSHAKYVKKLKDINYLNDRNVQYEAAKQIVTCDMFNLNIGQLITAKLIQLDEDTFLGVDLFDNIVVCNKISDKYVIYVITETGYTRIIGIPQLKETIVTKGEKDTLIKNIDIELVKQRRNLNNLAFYHKKILTTRNNSKGIMLHEIQAHRDALELGSNINYETRIPNIDVYVEKKIRQLRK